MSKFQNLSCLEIQSDSQDAAESRHPPSNHERTAHSQRSGLWDVNQTNLHDVFQAILKQIGNTEQEVSFLAVLQHLLKLCSGNDARSETLWQTIQELVAKATESKEEAQKLLNYISTRAQSHESGSRISVVHNENLLTNTPLTASSSSCLTAHPGSSQSHLESLLPPGTMSGAHPPPPPPPPPPGMLGGPPPPPPPPGAPLSPTSNPDLPQINIPRPRSKMKTFQWQKISANSVIGKFNIWTIIRHLDNKYDMDYGKMDELFSLNHETGHKRSSIDSEGQHEIRNKREKTEINLLDGKRSLNVNIFLKQFKMSHPEIVQLLRDGHCEKFGAERLRSLLKLLPSQEEIDSINGFTGDQEQLGNAEKFFICFMKLPNYRMRIEGLLIMEEFNINMEWIRPSIEAVIQAARDIQENQSLKELIYLILISGNYLNSGNYAGNAAGFKLSSLLKLTEIRANKPGMNLMHYVAQEAEQKNQKLLRFPDEMKFLKDASQVSVDALSNDINNIATKVRAITEQIVFAGADFQQQMAFFLKEANIEVVELEEDLRDIEIMRVELATFFCEDVKSFKLEECFKIMQTFCDRLKKATEENIKRRIQEAKAEDKRKSREFDFRRNSKDVTELLDNSITGDEDSVVDMLLADVRSGYTSRKYNVGNISVTKVTKVSLSPAGNSNSHLDMTDGSVSHHKKSSEGASGPHSPSDTLSQRRNRRSYAPSDDESLLDFLTKSADLPTEPEKPETRFERYSSLRRRRLERKGNRNIKGVYEIGRERAPSPNLIYTKTATTPTDTTPSGVKLRLSTNATRDRPKSEIFSDDRDGSRTLRRSQSLLDKSFTDQSSAEHARRNVTNDDLDESEALIRRLKQRLNRKSGRDTPPINEEGDDGTVGGDRKSSSEHSSSLSRNNSRWRRGITLSETNLASLPTTDANSTFDSTTSLDDIDSPQKVQERMPSQFLNNPESTKPTQFLSNDSSLSSEAPKNIQNASDPSARNQVSVSMRKKISSGMGTNIDGVLKTIEDTGRQIDMVGVTGPIRRTPEINTNSLQPHVAVVAHVQAPNTPIASVSKSDLKDKNDNPKNMSTLSVNKVRPTRNMSDSIKDIKRNNSANSTLNRTRSGSSLIRRSISKPKTPPPPQVRLCKSRAKSENENVSSTNVNNKNELNKTAKPASKSSKNVDQTKQKNARETNSNHTKSGDLHADKNLAGQKEYHESVESSVVKRKSTNRLSGDGRRQGFVFSDNNNDSLETQGLYTNENQEVFRRQSLTSTNTSTETLQADADNESSPFGQSNKVTKINGRDEESENPLADVAKWKIKRGQQRKSMNDILNETSNNYHTNNNFKVNDLRYDAASMFSYASSNDKDEGFETASGTMSQRTSMNSTLEAEIHSNPVLSRLAEKTRSIAENLFSDDSEIYIRPRKSTSTSWLHEKIDKKERTDNWAEQSISLNSVTDESSTDCVFSPDTAPKDNICSDDTVSVSKSRKSSSSTQEKGASTTNKSSVASSTNKSSKPHGVPGYMLPTDSSASKPSHDRASSTNSTKPTASSSAFNHNTSNRTITITSNRASVGDQNTVSVFKRDSVRASMKADEFQRGTIARTSVRGPRSSLHPSIDSTKSTLAPPSPGRSRSASNSSISSISSSTPNINAASSAASETTRQRLASSSRSGAPIYRPTTPSGQPTTPSTRPKTPSSQTSNSSTRSAGTVQTRATSHSQKNTGFMRSQSMRAISGHTLLENDTKRSTPISTTDGRRSVTSLSQSGRRSVTPLLTDGNRSTTPLLQERPHSTTPMISDGKSTKRFSFMAPTASSRAKADELTASGPTRTQSLTSIASASSSSHTTLRTQTRPSSAASGRKSPATTGLYHSSKPDHYQSLSTVVEQTADEDREEKSPKKSPFIIKRIINKSKASPIGSKSSSKSSVTILVTTK